MVELQPHMAGDFSGKDPLQEWYEDKYIAARAVPKGFDQDKF